MRKIYLIGTVDDSMYEKFSKQCDSLASQSSKPITIELSSDGGDPMAALAIVGKMRALHALNITFNAFAFGRIKSAAVLIFAACENRYADIDTIFMVHEASDRLKGDVSSLTKSIAQLQAEEQRWYALMNGFTKPDIDWKSLSLQTTHFTASQAVEYGLVDALTGVKNEQV